MIFVNVKKYDKAIKIMGVGIVFLVILQVIVISQLLAYYPMSDNNSENDKESISLDQVAFSSSPSSGYYPDQYSEPSYEEKYDGNFIRTSENSVSTFGADVDTGSYAIMRNSVTYGKLPSKEHIRTEEFLNYFDYHYPQHSDDDFKVYTECGPSYFGEGFHILKIGIRARSISEEERDPTTLIFVIDVSGSMESSNKLELIKETLPFLIDQLTDNDRIGIVIYSSEAEIVLEPTGLEKKSKILNSIESLNIGGVTNAEDGLKLGYEMAMENKIPGHITRLLLLSDGVANTGEHSVDGLVEMIQEYRNNGIYLSTYGFGMGEYNDELMEQLADNGDGKYGYIDTITEAKREFIRELTGNLQTIARDLKIQITFNPDIIEEYRLLGYVNRLMEDEDFFDYSKDSGDIGAGHTVTALYELKFKPTITENNYANIAFRYKEPKSGGSIELNFDLECESIKNSISQTTPQFRFALCVAEYAEILIDSENCNSKILNIIPMANQAVKEFVYKYPEELEFLEILEKANEIQEMENN